MTILAADDSVERLHSLVSLLKRTFPVDTVLAKSDALAAGQYCFNNPVDVLFAAIEMPRLDGLKLMEFARHGNPRAMVFLIADPDSGTEAALLKDEVDGLLYDPITEEQLLSALQRAQDADHKMR